MSELTRANGRERESMTAVLEMAGVSKSYGEGPTTVLALREVDLTVEVGELVAIMGPSGSGKSTLLTIAGTLEEATSGDVSIDGRSTAAMSRNDRARLRRRSIGYVFQDFNLLAGLTAAENVSLPLALAARQLVGIATGAIGEAELVERGEGRGARCLAPSAVELQRERDVLGRRQPGQQVEVLEHVADRPAAEPGPVVAGHRGRRLAVDADVT